MKKPLIFITNDDGIHAKGLHFLTEIARSFGEVVLVAPDRPQSGMSHAITLSSPLRFHNVQKEENYQSYICSGTPVDCVKLGLKIGLENRKPDLLLSGINHGSNASSNVIYSGTMAAAIEGAMENIPSIGFSLLDFDAHADFEPARPFVEEIIGILLKKDLPTNTCWNVNIPKLPLGEIKGIKVCRQARALWEEDYETRIDPYSSNYYWLTGKFEMTDLAEDTDLYALQNGYVSLVPIQFDWTDYARLDLLKKHF